MEKKKKKKRIVSRLAPILSVALILVTLLSTSVAATNGAGGYYNYNYDLVSPIPLKYVKSTDIVGFSLQSFESANEIMISPFDMYLYDVYYWGDNPNPNYTQTYVIQYPFIEGSGTRPFHLYGTLYEDGYGYTDGLVMAWETDYYTPNGQGSNNRNFMNSKITEFVYGDFVLSPVSNWETNYVNGHDYNNYEQRISISVDTYVAPEALTSVPYYRYSYSGIAYVPIVNEDGNVYSYDIIDLSSSNVYSRSDNGQTGRLLDFDIGNIYKILYEDGLPIPNAPIMVSNLVITLEPFVNGSLEAIQPSSSYFCLQGDYSSSLVPKDNLYTCGDFMEEYPLTRVRTEFMSDSNFFANITTAVSSFFNTDLFGSFSIGDLMLVSVGFGVLMFIIKMFRG